MNRETKEIITPFAKDSVVIHTWITGKEARDIKNIYLSNVKFSGNGEQEVDNQKELFTELENKTIEIVVVSVNGKTENIVDEILSMRKEDYEFVIDEINKATKGGDFLS